MDHTMTADEASLRSEHVLRALLNVTTEESIWFLDRDGIILMANETGARRFGRTPADMVGLPAEDFLPPEVREPRMALFRQVVETGESLQFIDERDGIRLHHSLCPVREENGCVTGVVSCSRDITGCSQAEESLRESLERLVLAVQGGRAGIWESDPETGETSWREGMAELLAVPADRADAESRHRLEFLHPEDRDRAENEFKAALEEKASLETEYRVVRGDGSVRWFASRAKTVTTPGRKIIGVDYDITELKAAEENLRRSVERYEQQVRLFDAVVSTTPDFVYVFDLQGRFLYANRRLLEVWGMNLPDIVGRTCRELGYEQWHHDMHMREIAQVIATKAPIKGEVPFEAQRTGIFGVYEYIFTPVLGAGGEVELIAGTTRDVTDRKQAEEELRKAHDELEQRVAERTALLENTVKELREKEHMLIHQSRMAAMGEMISNIAHQWRQPLNSLGLLVQGLPLLHRKDVLNEESLGKAVKMAMELITHMSGTIDDFRNFFKPEREKVHFRLGDVVTDGIKLIEAAFKSRQIDITVHCEEDPEIYGYPSEYAQVVLNILSNAKDAFEERRTSDPQVFVTISTRYSRSLLTIRDNAGGIEEGIIGKVFEPYFTTKGSQGTGIGLFMAKNIIEKNMGGRIGVRNTEQGAEFFIEV
ncbi:PAS domain-containing sensor histidine kinase [Geobacter sp. DSM 9736]|uniref:PAS domain-containing sensor histidine kinase n=1 Tax=Geobacter sp. DSM 9736 TaxID=1277350 RepID=UPI000B513A88|nr:PAS domain-containing sensor histidine kinase [Geobacter sp. DSM 9736]SNB44917.1 PAS domain S-box-containing protein [Geobacter sp. DSM 9736]